MQARDINWAGSSAPSWLKRRETFRVIDGSTEDRPVPFSALPFSGSTMVDALEAPEESGVNAVAFAPPDELTRAVWSVRPDGEEIADEARRAASEAAKMLRAMGIRPERVLADPDGGIALYVFGRKVLPGGARARYARVAATNDADIVILCVDRDTGERTAWTGHDLARDFERVLRFIAT